MRIGSFFSGAGGLDLAALELFPGSSMAWHSEINAAASKVLDHHWPTVPNLGDVTTIDWAAVEPVDVITGGFPCFPAGTMIHTRRGYMPIEQVAVGDYALTHLGRWRRVTATMTRPDATLWTVRSGGAPLTTTSEHPFYVRRQGRRWDNARRAYTRTFTAPEWIEAKDLTPGTHRVGSVLPPEAEPLESRLEWWWLAGRYIADGYRQQRKRTGAGNAIVGDQGRVIICCGPGKERELRDWIARSGLHATEAEERTVTKFHITNQPFYQFTEQFGSGAAGKCISPTGLALPEKHAGALLDGYLAGDGCTVKEGQSATTVSKALALGLAVLAHRARGVAASVSFYKRPPTCVIEGRVVNQKSTWKVLIPRANRTVVVDGDYSWRFVTGSVAAAARASVFNISVDGDESYVADGVIVHNCQDVSAAGRRAGLMEGTRSGLWSYMAEAVAVLRPRYVLVENVRGLLSAKAIRGVEPGSGTVGDGSGGHVLRAVGAVLGSLADLGFDAEWACVRASDVGACHRRERVFILAYPADADSTGSQGAEPTSGFDVSTGGDRGPLALLPTPQVADVTGGHKTRSGARSNELLLPGVAEAYAKGALLPTPRASDGTKGGPNQRGSAGDLMLPSAVMQLLPTPTATDGARGDCPSERDRRSPGLVSIDHYLPTPNASDGSGGGQCLEKRAGHSRQLIDYALVHGTPRWGDYEPAIRRQESLSRPAPSPTEPNTKGNPRLSAAFAEWLMFWPAGWVTDPDIGLSRNDQLRCIGNGVVPRQAVFAFRQLLANVRLEGVSA